MGRKRRAIDRLSTKNARPKKDRHNRRARNAGSPENPSVPLDPDAWEELGWLGSRSDAGIRVTHKTAIAHPPIMRAITLIARGVAKLPWNVLSLAPAGDDSTIDREHPAMPLLTSMANPSMRSYTWKTTMIYHALFRGNGYSAIVRRGADPAGLILLDPSKTSSYMRDDGKWYVTEAAGQKRRLPAADVVHFQNIAFDGLSGHDNLDVMANTFGLGPAARKWLSKLLSRGSTAGGLLQLPRELTPDARKKRQEEFDRYQAGLDNAFKTLALEDGAKWIRTMITPQEAAIFQILGHDAKSVANVFGVPAHKLGDDAKVAYNSLEQENASWLDECLDPWCVECETELTVKLLTTEQIEQRTHEVYIDRTALKLGDLQSQATAIGKLVNDGLWLPDEGRGRMGLPPLPNGEGKKLRLPVNIAVDGVIASQQGSGTGNPPAEDPPGDPASPPQAAMQNAARELVADRIRRLAKIHADNGPKAVARGPEAAADFARNHAERIRDALAPVLPVLALANGLAAPRRTAAEIADLLQCGADVDAQVEQVLSLSLQE